MRLLVVGLLLTCPACRISLVPAEDRGEDGSPEPVRTCSSPASISDLAAAPEPGSIRSVNEPLRPIEPLESSRAWLLESYQRLLAETRSQAARIQTLTRDVQAANEASKRLQEERASLDARCESLAAEVRELGTRSFELARRLAESELVRLEAEKLQLEAQLTPRKERSP